jgi:hypothetical protein
VRSAAFQSSAFNSAEACSMEFRSGWGRQVHDAGTGGPDDCLDAGDLVVGEVVHDDHVASREGGREELLDIGEEGLAARHRCRPEALPVVTARERTASRPNP